MITTREFFEHDAEDIINNIESIYSVQREESNKYLFEPFPSKDELLDKYEAGLDSPYEDLSDIDNLSDEEQSTIITANANAPEVIAMKIIANTIKATITSAIE